MLIRRDDLRGSEIEALLEEHLADMYAVSPPESVHALDLDGLRKPEITFWTAWDGDLLVGCGALKELEPTHGEIKSMRTAAASRGRGVASALMNHIVDEAATRGYRRLSLETGAEEFFAPARALYAKFGFVATEPFADYWADPNSYFMTKTLEPSAKEAISGAHPQRDLRYTTR
jgi:putative acetyltransferase